MSVPTVAASKTRQRGSCACLQHSSQPAIPIHVFATVIVSLSRCTCSQVDPHKVHVLLLQVCSDHGRFYGYRSWQNLLRCLKLCHDSHKTYRFVRDFAHQQHRPLRMHVYRSMAVPDAAAAAGSTGAAPRSFFLPFLPWPGNAKATMGAAVHPKPTMMMKHSESKGEVRTTMRCQLSKFL